MKVSLQRLIAHGHYDVKVDGVAVGQVVKKVERYNLRRAVTVITWDAYIFEDNKRVKIDTPYTRLRRDAVAAVVKQHTQKLEH